MGLEKRNGHVYYYKSRRNGEKVRKVYIGAGDFAYLAAKLDEAERLRWKEEVAYWKAERDHLEGSVAFLGELEEAAQVLVRAHLLASGFHQHKGQWRRRQRGP